MIPSVSPSVVGVLVLLSVTSCKTAVDGPVQDLSNRNTDFAAQLYRIVAGRTDTNVFLSPFMLSAGLSALLSASDGSAQEQLLQGLCLNQLDPQTIPGGSNVTCLPRFSV